MGYIKTPLNRGWIAGKIAPPNDLDFLRDHFLGALTFMPDVQFDLYSSEGSGAFKCYAAISPLAAHILDLAFLCSR